MRNVKDAATIALAIMIIKLVFRLIPPHTRFDSLEKGIWVELGIILTAYIVLFVIVYLILVVKRRHKKKDVER
ncbi:hypothetical protein C7Y47_06825 [Lysinibacillus sphaericus]|uniref:Uncharacterized protein n=1 Tax=Lysinibacillus sphaericus TaxID=1421 RepID=A0A544UQ74_LYSSH|nr:hypothetical protein [Lysinibacillus sp. SDF0037]TQR35990.1 hypothetical protein C7Y47_06825 [Lysinibacillus sp. SDF0037]